MAEQLLKTTRGARPYIGVTGLMSREESEATVVAYRDAWAGRTPTHDLMLGVLMSTKTLAGKQNKYPLRYPRVEDVPKCFVSAPGVLNLVHFAFNIEDMMRDVGLLERALQSGGAQCNGIQLNTPTITDPYEIGCFKSQLAYLRTKTHRIVLQVRPGERTPEQIAADACYWAGSGSIIGASDVLIDASGGTGQRLNITRCEAIVEEIRERTAYLEYGPQGIGVAGGLDAASLVSVRALVRDGVSIDTEGKQRDDAPGGGNLVLDKVRAYLCAAVHVLPARAETDTAVDR